MTLNYPAPSALIPEREKDENSRPRASLMQGSVRRSCRSACSRFRRHSFTGPRAARGTAGPDYRYSLRLHARERRSSSRRSVARFRGIAEGCCRGARCIPLWNTAGRGGRRPRARWVPRPHVRLAVSTTDERRMAPSGFCARVVPPRGSFQGSLVFRSVAAWQRRAVVPGSEHDGASPHGPVMTRAMAAAGGPSNWCTGAVRPDAAGGACTPVTRWSLRGCLGIECRHGMWFLGFWCASAYGLPYSGGRAHPRMLTPTPRSPPNGNSSRQTVPSLLLQGDTRRTDP
jgi:hypothetical protein